MSYHGVSSITFSLNYKLKTTKNIYFASVIQQQHRWLNSATGKMLVHSCVFGWIGRAVSVLLFLSVPNSPASEQTLLVTIDFEAVGFPVQHMGWV